MRLCRPTFAVTLLSMAGAAISPARADDVKRECVDAATLGQTLRDAGKLLAAREQMLRCARDECSVVRPFCARWLNEIEGQIPSVVVRVLDPDGNDRTDAKATMDGRPLKLDGKPTLLDPGQHLLVIEAPNAVRKEQKVLLVDREKSRLLNIQIASARPPGESHPAAPTPRSQGGIPTGVWILGGFGVAALGSGAYFGITARNELEHLKNSCSPSCTDAQTKTGRTDALVADISFGVGAAAIVGALVWAIMSPSRESASQKTSFSGVDVRPVAGGWFLSSSVRY
jgi:hypothetical protein